jgi:hypothetical protein
MKSAVLAGKALADDLGVPVDENRHWLNGSCSLHATT